MGPDSPAAAQPDYPAGETQLFKWTSQLTKYLFFKSDLCQKQ